MGRLTSFLWANNCYRIITPQVGKTPRIVLGCVYAFTNFIKRRQLWEYTLAILELALPIVFAGDFKLYHKTRG